MRISEVCLGGGGLAVSWLSLLIRELMHVGTWELTCTYRHALPHPRVPPPQPHPDSPALHNPPAPCPRPWQSPGTICLGQQEGSIIRPARSWCGRSPGLRWEDGSPWRPVSRQTGVAGSGSWWSPRRVLIQRDCPTSGGDRTAVLKCALGTVLLEVTFSEISWRPGNRRCRGGPEGESFQNNGESEVIWRSDYVKSN